MCVDSKTEKFQEIDVHPLTWRNWFSFLLINCREINTFPKISWILEGFYLIFLYYELITNGGRGRRKKGVRWDSCLIYPTNWPAWTELSFVSWAGVALFSPKKETLYLTTRASSSDIGVESKVGGGGGGGLNELHVSHTHRFTQ